MTEVESNSTNEAQGAEQTGCACRRAVWPWGALVAGAVLLAVGLGAGWMIGRSDRNATRGSGSSSSSESDSERREKDGTSESGGRSKTFTLPGGVKMEMVYVEPGSFMMGSPESEEGRVSDEKLHRVTLTESYWIGKYPVTQAQWSALVSAMDVSFTRGRPTACFSKSGKCGDLVRGMDTSDFPMENISWNDCKALVDALNRNDREGRRWSLPTEAQWEFAARGGNQSRGYTYSGGNEIDAVGWYYENSGLKKLSDSDWDLDKLQSNKCRSHSVKEKENGNELGIVGMSGNVWEWCADWYGDYPEGSVTDPTGPASGEARVLRGGSWNFHARYCRSALRDGNLPGYRYYFYGLRLCCSAGLRE